MTVKKAIITTSINKLEVDPERSLLAFQMVGDRAVIDPKPIDETIGGRMGADGKPLIKSAETKEPYRTGTVMSFGGGEYGVEIPESLRTGLVVNYFHQSAIDYEVDKKVYHLVRVSDIFQYL